MEDYIVVPVDTSKVRQRKVKDSLSEKEFKQGYRLVEGKLVKLQELFPNRYAKLKHFVANIPHITSEEQEHILRHGQLEHVKEAIILSMRMTRLALKEFNKAKRRRSSFSAVLLPTAENTKARRDMESVFNDRKDLLSNLGNSWRKSYQKVLFEEQEPEVDQDTLEYYLTTYGKENFADKIDSYLPYPKVLLPEQV